MDLDGDVQGVSASIHAPPTFASVVSGTTTSAPLEHALPMAQPEHDDQVGYTPQTWKPPPRHLHFIGQKHDHFQKVSNFSVFCIFLNKE
jgi:hypothetical protein